MKNYDLVVAGGGAAGFFAAINAGILRKGLSILILEKGSSFLGKVKVSGGGRCNVTHFCFDPAELSQNYPRGEKELLGPFHTFQPADTMQWFEERGVSLKVEQDNRVFPESDDSRTIIECFMTQARHLGILLQLQNGVEDFRFEDGKCRIITTREEITSCSLLIATGSSTRMYELLASKGLQMVQPVPSLFTFNIKSPLLEGLQGLSCADAEVSVSGTGLSAQGPVLITHWGLSGPAILRLSAWGARELHQKGYQFRLLVNFLPGFDAEEIKSGFRDRRTTIPRKTVSNSAWSPLPQRLWERIVQLAGINPATTWADVSSAELARLSTALTATELQVNGKSTFKEEFVTCGGVGLREVNFRTMEAKKIPGLFFAGEVLDIDAITGGFNFQAAWTTGFLAAKAIAGRSGNY